MMATITIKDIPDDLYEALKAAARANRRSINREVIYYIERAVRSQKTTPEETLARARMLREKTRDYPLTDEQLAQAKADGRP